jgi:hypothetical protein
MEISKFTDQILLLANEDYSGLWEVYGEAKDIYGELSQEELINRSKKAIMDLVNKGWIQFYWCKEPLENDRVTLIGYYDVINVLSEMKYWEQPKKNSVSVRFSTTSEGENAFAKKFLI